MTDRHHPAYTLHVIHHSSVVLDPLMSIILHEVVVLEAVAELIGAVALEVLLTVMVADQAVVIISLDQISKDILQQCQIIREREVQEHQAVVPQAGMDWQHLCLLH